ncbi:MAG: YfhO family protein, partial [Eubacterium sp.]|nr:YfhO family protein [Eubacterium sp.]
DRLIEKKDGRLYVLALFYALYCNYYIAFMICIFCVIWYLIHEFKSFRQFFFRGIAFALYSFVAAGMAAVILLPAYLGIRETSSGSDMGLPGHGWITGFWDLISRQFDMAYPVTHDNFDGNANLYFGIFAVIFLLLYLMNREIGLWSKCKKLLLVLFFYFSFNEKILNFIWHGFHDQYGIPNRFSFLYGFVLLSMAFEVLERKDSIRLWEPVAAALLSLGILGGSYYYAEEPLELEVLWSAAFLILVYGVILFLMKKDIKRTAVYQMLISTVITGEIIVTSLMGFDSNGQISISKFFYATEDMEQALEDNRDGTFFRSELAEGRIVDESSWYPMHAISLFGSTARSEMVDIMNSLGFDTGINEYLYKGSTPVTNLMFNLRDYYFHEKDQLLTDFDYVDTYGTMRYFRNPTEGMSLGYGISEDIDTWYYYSDYPFRVLNDFCYQGYGVNTVFEDIPIPDPDSHGCTTDRTNDGEYYFEYEEKEPDNIVFTIDLPEGSGSLYLFYDGSQVENTKISVNGIVRLDGDLDGRILAVGEVEKESVVTVAMSLKGENDSGYVRLSAATFNQENYESLVQEMTFDTFQVTKMTDCHIEGSFDAVEEEYLFFSIPFDDGWKVAIDGKNTETTTIGNAFLSVIIPEGEHRITLDYVPEGFKTGRLISLAGVLAYLALCICTGRRRKKDRMTGGCEDGEEENFENESGDPESDGESPDAEDRQDGGIGDPESDEQNPEEKGVESRSVEADSHIDGSPDDGHDPAAGQSVC